ncbi:MAG TPA: hypothetical protein VFY41_08125 [Nitrososphaeraceae archaeon]|nr:hypothetical protein [Nitrososphaeraceae archaeon]
MRLLKVTRNSLRTLSYQAEGKIIPKTDRHDIKISSEIPLGLGFGH